MSNVVIEAEDLAKQYRLGQVGRRTLSHDINRWWHTLRGKEDPYLKIGQENNRATKGESEYVWALKDINFRVKEGEVLGIIGRNGAGKSTLLKILSKVTAPTSGQVKIRGRIASLLEVGTGFHPELSGKENIFLNGAILGMTNKEVSARFDEIVDFAGVERYIDTPVKRYSSGMYVRLAFAVAAHLEPEILIIDEVLAVGDAEFQKKCLGKMKDVSEKDGRTVLFVSHNMGSIAQLCDSGLLLSNGYTVVNGTVNEAIQKYLSSNTHQPYYKKANDSLQSKKIWFRQISVGTKNKAVTSEIFHDEDIYIRFSLGFAIDKEKHDYSIMVTVQDVFKSRITSFQSGVIKTNEITLKIVAPSFVRGSYSLTCFVIKPHTERMDLLDDICQFTIIDNGSEMNIHNNYNYGYVFTRHDWQM